MENFEWPTLASIKESQHIHASRRPKEASEADGLWRLPGGPAWIPDDFADIQLRLAVISHCGSACDCGAQSTGLRWRSNFVWSTISTDIKLFVRQCIRCLSRTYVNTVPHPFGPALHRKMPNNVVHFDNTYMGGTTTGD